MDYGSDFSLEDFAGGGEPVEGDGTSAEQLARGKQRIRQSLLAKLDHDPLTETELEELKMAEGLIPASPEFLLYAREEGREA